MWLNFPFISKQYIFEIYFCILAIMYCKLLSYISDIIESSKRVYSPLRTNGLAHRMYLQRHAMAIPIDFELVEMKSLVQTKNS